MLVYVGEDSKSLGKENNLVLEFVSKAAFFVSQLAFDALSNGECSSLAFSAMDYHYLPWLLYGF